MQGKSAARSLAPSWHVSKEKEKESHLASYAKQNERSSTSTASKKGCEDTCASVEGVSAMQSDTFQSTAAWAAAEVEGNVEANAADWTAASVDANAADWTAADSKAVSTKTDFEVPEL